MTHAKPSAAEPNLLLAHPEKQAELDRFVETLLLSEPDTTPRGHLIECLHKAQDIFGYLPREIQRHLAQKLGLHHSDVYGVISFYSYFTDKPTGEFRINVCKGTACFVRGADRLIAEFNYYLNIEEGETTPDQMFSLGGLRCVGACSLAPVVMVNDKVYGNVVPRMVPDIINECK